MKIEDLNRVTKYYRDRGYRGDFTGKKGHERLIKGMELLNIKVPAHQMVNIHTNGL